MNKIKMQRNALCNIDLAMTNEYKAIGQNVYITAQHRTHRNEIRTWHLRGT